MAVDTQRSLTTKNYRDSTSLPRHRYVRLRSTRRRLEGALAAATYFLLLAMKTRPAMARAWDVRVRKHRRRGVGVNPHDVRAGPVRAIRPLPFTFRP